MHADASPGPGRSADFLRVGERGERDGPTTHRGEPFLSFDAPQEARVALNILTGNLDRPGGAMFALPVAG